MINRILPKIESRYTISMRQFQPKRNWSRLRPKASSSRASSQGKAFRVSVYLESPVTLMITRIDITTSKVKKM